MNSYSAQEREEILLDYFGSASEDEPLCPDCGEDLEFRSQYPSGDSPYRLRVDCPDCRAGFIWEQDRDREDWTSIQLSYCLERYRQGDTPRCPVDDSYIVCTEFTDDTVEFRCPYCNRSGRARTGVNPPAPESQDLR
ncbi:MAG: hypothetical protein OXT71_09860 [Acidobacteriota bacterium]|nr:hypothetical protein [Acidobacteriota bacterium]